MVPVQRVVVEHCMRSYSVVAVRFYHEHPLSVGPAHWLRRPGGTWVLTVTRSAPSLALYRRGFQVRSTSDAAAGVVFVPWEAILSVSAGSQHIVFDTARAAVSRARAKNRQRRRVIRVDFRAHERDQV